uniref:Uncharacterized protein n=1 Tax=Trichogramma kaykai TaxID=54128 RepID=A0ABD2W6F6_9HYME
MLTISRCWLKEAAGERLKRSDTDIIRDWVAEQGLELSKTKTKMVMLKDAGKDTSGKKVAAGGDGQYNKRVQGRNPSQGNPPGKTRPPLTSGQLLQPPRHLSDKSSDEQRDVTSGDLGEAEMRLRGAQALCLYSSNLLTCCPHILGLSTSLAT